MVVQGKNNINQERQSGSVGSNTEREIDHLADAPTGAPMERRHWAFLVVSGIVLPVLILWWGWA